MVVVDAGVDARLWWTLPSSCPWRSVYPIVINGQEFEWLTLCSQRRIPCLIQTGSVISSWQWWVRCLRYSPHFENHKRIQHRDHTLSYISQLLASVIHWTVSVEITDSFSGIRIGQMMIYGRNRTHPPQEIWQQRVRVVTILPGYMLIVNAIREFEKRNISETFWVAWNRTMPSLHRTCPDCLKSRLARGVVKA